MSYLELDPAVASRPATQAGGVRQTRNRRRSRWEDAVRCGEAGPHPHIRQVVPPVVARKWVGRARGARRRLLPDRKSVWRPPRGPDAQSFFG